jgi:hypothetical protein
MPGGDDVVYVLQCDHVHNHDDGGTDQESLAVYGNLEDALWALRRYLPEEYGHDYKTGVFVSVTEFRDDEHCGGVMIEAEDMEGDVLRLWIQELKMKKKPGAGK